MRLFLLFTVIILIFTSFNFAQDYSDPLFRKLFFGIEGGLTVGKTDYKNSIPGTGTKFTLDYYFFSRDMHSFAVRLQGGGLSIHGRDNRKEYLSFRTGTYFLGGGGIYSYTIDQKYSPYAFIGISNLWLDIDLTVAETGNTRTLEDINSFSFDTELGIKIVLSKSITFNLNGSMHFLTNDVLDNLEIGFNNDFYIKAMAGVSIALSGDGDRDNDGIPDRKDACPEQPEDFDGFEDEDGCPDPDNDKDGILDIHDKCPNMAEDFDGFEDSDGCPDLDNDGDGIPDEIDKCPNHAEDFDGFQDEDGCPDPDNDGDGILDVNDKCPDLAEDFDGFEDTDGCPDLDNDGDGIPDKDDQCPDQAETFNNYRDADGCPDSVPDTRDQGQLPPEKQAPAREKQEQAAQTSPGENIPDRFTIHGVQTFEQQSSKIKPEAYSDLNAVAEMIKKQPKSRWRIEGHTDNSLSENPSLELSRKQAQAIVNYFVSKGIPASKFQIAPIGSKQPIASNDKVYGRMRNNRVELIRIE